MDSTRRLVAVGVALPLVWFALLAASYALVPVACASGSRASLHGASAAAVISTVWLSAAAVRIDGSDRAPISAWRRWSSVRIAVGAEGLLFVHAVLLLALANAVVDPCS